MTTPFMKENCYSKKHFQINEMLTPSIKCGYFCLAITANVPPYPDPHKITRDEYGNSERTTLISVAMSAIDCSSVSVSRFSKEADL